MSSKLTIKFTVPLNITQILSVHFPSWNTSLHPLWIMYAWPFVKFHWNVLNYSDFDQRVPGCLVAGELHSANHKAAFTFNTLGNLVRLYPEISWPAYSSNASAASIFPVAGAILKPWPKWKKSRKHLWLFFRWHIL